MRLWWRNRATDKLSAIRSEKLKLVLWVVALLVAFGVGFALGVALWESNGNPAGEGGQ
jgi:predicted membrane protein